MVELHCAGFMQRVSCQVSLLLGGCLHPWQCRWPFLLGWRLSFGEDHVRGEAHCSVRQALPCQHCVCYLFGIFPLPFF